MRTEGGVWSGVAAKCCLKCVSSLSGLHPLDGTGLKVVPKR